MSLTLNCCRMTRIVLYLPFIIYCGALYGLIALANELAYAIHCRFLHVCTNGLHLGRIRFHMCLSVAPSTCQRAAYTIQPPAPSTSTQLPLCPASRNHYTARLGAGLLFACARFSNRCLTSSIRRRRRRLVAALLRHQQQHQLHKQHQSQQTQLRIRSIS